SLQHLLVVQGPTRVIWETVDPQGVVNTDHFLSWTTGLDVIDELLLPTCLRAYTNNRDFTVHRASGRKHLAREMPQSNVAAHTLVEPSRMLNGTESLSGNNHGISVVS